MAQYIPLMHDVKSILSADIIQHPLWIGFTLLLASLEVLHEELSGLSIKLSSRPCIAILVANFVVSLNFYSFSWRVMQCTVSSFF